MTASTMPQVGTGTWVIDPVHSSVEFAVKHMMVATAKGRFTGVAGTIRLDDANPANSSVEATIDLTSVDTGNAQRDGHLRAEDFFHAERFARASFRSTRVEPIDAATARVYGELTIRDVTKEIALDVEFEGQGQDAFGKQRTGFTAQAAINRHDFGITYNVVLEAGGVAIGERVKLTMHISAVRQD